MAAWAAAVISVLSACDNDSDEQRKTDAPASAAMQSSERKLPAASIELPQSPAEKKLLSDVGCYDDKECLTFDKFDRQILKEYPDISSIRYRIPRELDADPETARWMHQDFHRALYFAKQIRLADGQSLFDFIKNCSRGFSTTDFAQVDRDLKTGTSFISMQYFPVLRRQETGKDLEMQILFERRGDKIEARSPFFSSSVLQRNDFLASHGLTCVIRR
ncbi:hypothetical protein C266_13979 [Pandoraea sp. SD6-2]|nr:hypothetical protein C266_13979 [Pandoraea sp. SD6-2]